MNTIRTSLVATAVLLAAWGGAATVHAGCPTCTEATEIVEPPVKQIELNPEPFAVLNLKTAAEPEDQPPEVQDLPVNDDFYCHV
jgi:hypothetical protein